MIREALVVTAEAAIKAWYQSLLCDDPVTAIGAMDRLEAAVRWAKDALEREVEARDAGVQGMGASVEIVRGAQDEGPKAPGASLLDDSLPTLDGPHLPGFNEPIHEQQPDQPGYIHLRGHDQRIDNRLGCDSRAADQA